MGSEEKLDFYKIIEEQLKKALELVTADYRIKRIEYLIFLQKTRASRLKHEDAEKILNELDEMLIELLKGWRGNNGGFAVITHIFRPC